MKVDVYYNLHKKTFSVKHKGKVIAHEDYVWIKDAQFVVSEAGRQRVLREKKKNVHAFVRGEWLDLSEGRAVTEGTKFSGYAKYNPYKADTFMSDDLPIHKADAVLCIGYEEKPRLQYYMKEVA
tara:strand:+ start:4868 stop:5239 length:372 start_codon:yes stop_codon:yes gene_type:complete